MSDDISPAVLMGLLHAMQEVEEAKAEANTLQKDIISEAKEKHNITGATLKKLYKAFKSPEDYREEVELLDGLLRRINM